MSQDGLTARSQLRLRVHTPGYSVELDPQVRFGPGKYSGTQDRDWVWHSNYFVQKLHNALTYSLTHSSPSTSLFSIPPPNRCTG